MESVEQDFSSLGTVTSVKVLEAPPGQTVKAALVTFSSEEEATYAKDSLNGVQPDGFPEPLMVRFANNPGSGPGGGGKAPCKYFAQGMCTKGEQCTFSHELGGEVQMNAPMY
jgi:RNA recognition motif-containing protein